MDGNELVKRLGALLDDWHIVCASATSLGVQCERFKGRLLEFMDNIAKEVAGGRESPIDLKTPGVVSVGAAIGPKVGLIGPITAATGQALMALLVEVSNGVVDDAIKEALRKHCEKRFGATDLTKLNEAMGRQLVEDFTNVKDGKQQLGYNADGCMVFFAKEG